MSDKLQECALPSCKAKFKPLAVGTSREQKYCCSPHRHKHAALKNSVIAQAEKKMLTCALEGCEEQFLGPGRQRFCCVQHERQHSRAQRRSVALETALSPDEEIKKRAQEALERELRKDVGNLTIVIDSLRDAVTTIRPGDIPPVTFRSKGKNDPETFVLILSDEHVGAVTPGGYCTDYFEESWDYYIDRVLKIHEIMGDTIPFRDECVILNVGDHSTGQGIYPNQASYTHPHTLAQVHNHFIPSRIKLHKSLATRFKRIRDIYVRGNHGRTGKENPDEVNFDSFGAAALGLYYADREGDKSYRSRVTIEAELENWYRIVDIEGFGFHVSHGDTVKQYMGYPYYGVMRKVAGWTGAFDEDWRYLVIGHFHTPMFTSWNRKYVFQNGTFVIGDEFPRKTLGVTSEPTQYVFGVHERRGVTWQYPLNVDVRTKKAVLSRQRRGE